MNNKLSDYGSASGRLMITSSQMRIVPILTYGITFEIALLMKSSIVSFRPGNLNNRFNSTKTKDRALVCSEVLQQAVVPDI